MKILIATRNPAKLREIGEYLGKGFEPVYLADFPDSPTVAETMPTFIGNAIQKARTFQRWSGLPTIADDGGLSIAMLDGMPGVLSRRWPTEEEMKSDKQPREKSDEELVTMTLESLKGVSWEHRKARFNVAAVFCNGEYTLHSTIGVEGYITEERAPIREPGFPFRALFWVSQFQKLFQDLTPEEHAVINHRRKAIQSVVSQMRQHQIIP